jgi:integrase
MFVVEIGARTRQPIHFEEPRLPVRRSGDVRARYGVTSAASTTHVWVGGIPMSVESVSRRFGQLVEQIGLGQVRAHDLRHGYATRLLEAGVHPKVVSEAMGHVSVGITLDIYSHVLPSMSRTAADAIEAVFGK